MKTMKKLKCKVPGCNKPHHAQGYCQTCYDDLRKKKPGKQAKLPVQASAKKAPPLTKGKEDKHLETPPVESGKARTRKGSATTPPAPAGAAASEPKPGRLGLIKTRHEAMKREIDQIREDLESEEEE
ncbi:MAG TPA: hypothetical protein VGP72_05760 [Planctomycetota bacterium]